MVVCKPRPRRYLGLLQLHFEFTGNRARRDIPHMCLFLPSDVMDGLAACLSQENEAPCFRLLELDPSAEVVDLRPATCSYAS